jgi:dihydroorotase
MTAVDRMTVGPAKVFGLDGGSLDIGKRADVCVFDPDASWVVNEESLRSRGKNTPLLHRSLTGRAICTVVGGQVVHDLTEVNDADN